MTDARFNPARPFHVEGIIVPGKGVYSHRTGTAWAVMSPAGELCRRAERDQARLVCEAHNDIHEQGFAAGVAAAEAKAAKAPRPEPRVVSLPRAIRVLIEGIEWGGTERDEDGREEPACPWCGEAKPDGHLDNCAVGLVLKGVIASSIDAVVDAPRGPEVFNG